jgi:hypothetical protein
VARPAPLTADQRRALAGLSRAGQLEGVYLAGDAAVAHHLEIQLNCGFSSSNAAAQERAFQI